MLILLHMSRAAPLIGSSTGAGVLYEARSWYEVEAWLFGLSTQPRRRAAPLKISNARNIDPAEIDICKREDGSDYLLGAGSFGEVRPGFCRGMTADRPAADLGKCVLKQQPSVTPVPHQAHIQAAACET